MSMSDSRIAAGGGVTLEIRDRVLEQYADVFRQHPFYAAPDLVQALRQIIESPEFRRVTDAP